MTQKQTLLIFDGDDTLWNTMPLYGKAKRQFFRLMESQGFNPPRVSRYLENRDRRNVARFGFSKQRFAVSMLQTYQYFCRKHRTVPSKGLQKQIQRIADSVFKSPPAVIPSATGVLRELKKTCRLILATKGDPEVQRQRISASGLKGFFEQARIVKSKKVDTFRTIVGSCKVQPCVAWSIGNSVKSDINPALQAGLNAIWIPRDTWVYEEGRPLRRGRVFKARSLRQVPKILRALQTK